ncbi:gamma-glutamyl-gamma-aminobutyrate hydrolase family protein [uncultured Bosea sp.]|uniref:gamma-glutamyl-gamma-aminobutyrate hydrolase family protein n=1 Tax=uncultured Bosea sp. TaxID=211457 RepID=UPI0026000A74|nr:gamma-glutamyl-gamma-aminobutyrate hydrolase family protein [uncultured Bosea sp.]
MSLLQRPLIVITQRVDVVPSYGERRDALDQNWFSLLDAAGCDVVPLPNHPATALSLARRLKPALVILSGGNGVMPDNAGYAPERNATETALLDWAKETETPVLGVCRGFQFMNVYLGGTLSPVYGHVACSHATRSRAGAFAEVNSYHDYGIVRAGLAALLEEAATAPDGTIEGAYHRTLPWLGIMWHPERAIPDAAGVKWWLASLVREAASTRRISFP